MHAYNPCIGDLIFLVMLIQIIIPIFRPTGIMVQYIAQVISPFFEDFIID